MVVDPHRPVARYQHLRNTASPASVGGCCTGLLMRNAETFRESVEVQSSPTPLGPSWPPRLDGFFRVTMPARDALRRELLSIRPGEIMKRDPIAKLTEDHQVFLRTVRSFRGELENSRPNGRGADEVPRRVADFARFLLRDVDRIHGQQVERGLFPVLGRYIPIEGGPIPVMVGEHEILRSLQRDLERSGRMLEEDPLADDARQTIEATSGGVEDLLVMHVLKEDSVLFPMAYRVLSSRETEEVARVFDEVESAVGPPGS